MNEIRALGLTGPPAPSAAPKAGQSAEPRESVQLGRVDEPLTQALTLASMHQQIPGEFLIHDFTPGPAEPFREQARKLLPDNQTERQVELTALSLFEQSVSAAPKTITLIDSPQGGVAPGQGLAESGLYTAKLAAALGGGPSVLSPALMTVLGDFKADRLWTGTYFPGSNSQYRAIGEFQDQRLANLVTSQGHETPQGIRMRGILEPLEAAHIEIALNDMERKIPGSTDSFHTVHVRTVLGESQDPKTGKPIGGVAGLADEEEMGLAREVTRNLDSCKETVYHEAGHELDRKLGNLSLREDSPFGKTSEPEDYVSEYARTYPWEDLAETNRVLFSRFDRIQANPDLWLHANGEVGNKLAFLLKEAYGLSVPPPSARFGTALEAVRQGQSPFGWDTGEGSKILAEYDMKRSLKTMLGMWDGQGEPPFFLTQGPDAAKYRWLADKLMGVQLPEPAPTGVGMGMGMGGSLDLGPQSLPALKESLRALAAVPARLAELLPRARAALEGLPPGRERNQLEVTVLFMESEYERHALAPLYRGEYDTAEQASELLRSAGVDGIPTGVGPQDKTRKLALVNELNARETARMSQISALAGPYDPAAEPVTPHPIAKVRNVLKQYQPNPLLR